MKSLGRAHRRKLIKDEVRTEMMNYAEHFDLVMLNTLHNEFGFGKKRLKRFYEAFCKNYERFKERYYDDDDVKIFGERGDTYVMREDLKKIGFDYEAEIRRLRDEGYGNN